MSERMQERRDHAVECEPDRRVVACVVWRRDVIVGIVAVRRCDGWSALIPLPRRAKRAFGRGGFSRDRVRELWGDLTLAVEWALWGLEFEDVRGFGMDPLEHGQEPAECGSVRTFDADVVGVDIGEFETPTPGRLH